jgi:hypothetical protein
MAVNRDPQPLTLHPAVEALHEAIRPRRIGLGRAMPHLQLAGLFKAIRREAGSSVRQDVRDLEGKARTASFRNATALVASSSSLTARCTQRELRSMATYS